MTDLFEVKAIKPMLIGEISEPFDSPDYSYELKIDGERCIAYLDPQSGTTLRNKRNMDMLKKVPELSMLHKQVHFKCILDGELAVMVDGKPNFFEIQRRSITSDQFKIKIMSTHHPASFIAFDILYCRNSNVTSEPLTRRRALLQDAVIENERIAVTRSILNDGIAFYHLVEEQDLEGIVAKRKDSQYFFDKRTKDWIKIKNLQDDDFVVGGYVIEGYTASLVLGQFIDDRLTYKGHVLIGTSSEDFYTIQSLPQIKESPFAYQKDDHQNVVWVSPTLVCTVRYMMLTSSGHMRQPVFKGIRLDKQPLECQAK